MNPYPVGTILYTIQPSDALWLLAQRYDTTVDAIFERGPTNRKKDAWYRQRYLNELPETSERD